eukprot:g18572.t1
MGCFAEPDLENGNAVVCVNKYGAGEASEEQGSPRYIHATLDCAPSRWHSTHPSPKEGLEEAFGSNQQEIPLPIVWPDAVNLHEV